MSRGEFDPAEYANAAELNAAIGVTGYVSVPIAPDPDRDARVAARRAKDAARYGRAFARIFDQQAMHTYAAGWSDGYAASEEHHNRHYGVVDVGPLCVHGCVADGQACGEFGCTEPGSGPDLAPDDCLRMTEDPRLSECPAAGSPRCVSCVWRPVAGGS